MSAAKTYRYPGAQPFSTEQEQIFFGRDKNIRDLYQLIQLEPLIVLFAKSGLGKSSLLNAGLLPKAEREGQFQPIRIRLGACLGDGAPSPLQITLQALDSKASWLKKIQPPNEKSLWQALKNRQISNKDESRYLLIFDQFEELFSYPEQQVQAFAKDLAEALYLNIPDRFRERLETQAGLLNEEELAALHRSLHIHVVLAIRSDRMSLLDQLKRHLPNILATTYELPALDSEQAENAILSPAYEQGNYASPVFDYQDEAVEFLLHYLSNGHTEPIESFQLQILCQWAEQQLVLKQGRKKIAPVDIQDPANILENYYFDKIGEIEKPEEQQAARRLIEEGLIFEEEERRLSLYEGQIRKSFGVSDELLHQLLATHLIRSEPSLRGGYTYELSHDTLVAPVLKAKTERLAEERRKQEEADRQQREQEMAELRRKAEEEKQLRTQAELAGHRARRNSRIASFVSVLAVVAAAVAIIFFFNSQRTLDRLQAETAAKQAAEAQQAQVEAAELVRQAQTYYNAEVHWLAKKLLEKAIQLDSLNTDAQTLLQELDQ